MAGQRRVGAAVALAGVLTVATAALVAADVEPPSGLTTTPPRSDEAMRAALEEAPERVGLSLTFNDGRGDGTYDGGGTTVSLSGEGDGFSLSTARETGPQPSWSRCFAPRREGPAVLECRSLRQDDGTTLFVVTADGEPVRYRLSHPTGSVDVELRMDVEGHPTPEQARVLALDPALRW